jgi:Tfp pilus assembly protein PilO
MKTLRNQSGRYGTIQWAMGLLALVLLALFFFATILPANKRRAVAMEATRMQRAQLAANQKEATQLSTVKEEVKQLKGRLTGLDKKLPKRPDTDQFGREITQVSEACALKKVNMQVGVPRRTELFSEMPIGLNFNGDFTSVMAFLRQTEELQRLTRVRSLNIKTKDPAKGQVEVDVAMNIYFADE